MSAFPQRTSLAVLLLASSACIGAAFAQTPLKPVGTFTAPASDDDKKPRGVSGMACLGAPADASRECFAIVDEETGGQVVTLTKDAMTVQAGKLVQFAKKGESANDVLGKRTRELCKEPGKFAEVDGEGIAVDAQRRVYVVGSHSCTSGGKFKESSFMLSRFSAASATAFLGAAPPAVERTWRIADALRASSVSGSFGNAEKTKGTNIEGLAVIGDDIYVGLRTPVDGANVHLVSAPIAALFAPGAEPLPANLVRSHKITLAGESEAGIRDLAALRDGRLLILSGPTVEQPGISYKLWLATDPKADQSSARLLRTLDAKMHDGKIGKAETVVVLDETAEKLSVLVAYDNIDEGAPTLYEIPLPAK